MSERLIKDAVREYFKAKHQGGHYQFQPGDNLTKMGVRLVKLTEGGSVDKEQKFFLWFAGMILMFLLMAGLIVGLTSCDSPPQQQRETPTAVVFYEYPWQLTDSTQHHYAQPWDTYLYISGEIVILRDKQTRYPFFVKKGYAPAPRTDRDDDTNYAFHEIQWKDGGQWSTLRIVCTPGDGILWVDVDGGEDDDLLRLVRL